MCLVIAWRSFPCFCYDVTSALKKKKKERKKDKEKKDMVEKRLAFPNVAQKLISETKGSCLEAASIFFFAKIVNG